MVRVDGKGESRESQVEDLRRELARWEDGHRAAHELLEQWYAARKDSMASYAAALGMYAAFTGADVSKVNAELRANEARPGVSPR
jgi:hypothetical protein